MQLTSEVRSLVRLAEGASSARVLNLTRRETRSTRDGRRPLFKNDALDGAIIVKHRVRPHEMELFAGVRSLATKVLLPIDRSDLQAGAFCFLVGERTCERTLLDRLGFDDMDDRGAHDREVLAALDELPSLDPFLTREHLQRRALVVDQEYFDISEADMDRMTTFVRREIIPLVTLCFGGVGASSSQADRLVQKILATEIDATMDPLRMTLKLEPDQFLEGIFCWKGFLYYKWVLAQQFHEALEVTKSIETVKSRGPATAEESTYLLRARARLSQGIRQACKDVQTMLKTYDTAFVGLTQQADPVGFRDFLLAAPEMFFKVGDRLGAIQHITSFWRYRFPSGSVRATPPELCGILQDFENSLGMKTDREQTWA